MKNFSPRSKLLWLFILLLALILRLYGLGLNPPGLTHDEIHDLLNAKSLAITGTQVPGTASGIFTPNAKCVGNCIFAELGPFLLMIWMKIFRLSLFWSKLPFVFASVGIVYFGGKLFENLSGNKSVGLITALLIAINPWAILLGRSAYESLFAYVFYLWALFLYTKRGTGKLNLIAAFAVSILGFLSYIGTKPLFPLITAWGTLYNLQIQKSKKVVDSLIIIGFSIVITFAYLLILRQTPAGARLGELRVDQANINLIEEVNSQRRRSLEIPLIRDIAINKYTILSNYYLTKYLGIFSPQFLFIKGDGSPEVFSLPNHSYFYLIDAVFLIYGVIALSGLTIVPGLFVITLILMMPIPSALSEGGIIYALRSGLFFPILLGIVGWGIFWIGNKVPKSKILFYRITIILIYSLFLFNFLIIYWYRLPFDKSAGWFFHERALIRYLRLAQNYDSDIVAVVKEPQDLMYLDAFYSGTYNNAEDILATNRLLEKQDYRIGKTRLAKSCEVISNFEGTIVIQEEIGCVGKQPQNAVIANPRDAGGVYGIINDKLCLSYSKNKYPYPRYIQEFQVEKLNKEEFCKKWITNPTGS